MKKILLALMLVGSLQAAEIEVTLKFESERAAKDWIIWYLDGGGEQVANFFVGDWKWNRLCLYQSEPIFDGCEGVNGGKKTTDRDFN